MVCTRQIVAQGAKIAHYYEVNRDRVIMGFHFD
jgi:hypothetical protein